MVRPSGPDLTDGELCYAAILLLRLLHHAYGLTGRNLRGGFSLNFLQALVVIRSASGELTPAAFDVQLCNGTCERSVDRRDLLGG